MAVSDWRAWTAQQSAAFPGQGNIIDWEEITNNTSIVTTLALGPGLSVPSYPYLPTPAAGADPFGGWNAQQETRTGTARPYIPGLD